MTVEETRMILTPCNTRFIGVRA